MLISDYDGTLNVNDDLLFKIDLKLNINAIKEFRCKGNIFVISTARGYNSIKEEIVKYNIPYDYLTCNNFKLQYRNFHTYIKNECTKLDGANFLKNYLKIEDIYAVGDSKDELELLQAYNGYKMIFSDPALLNKNIQTTSSVHKVIKKIKKV